MEYIPGVEEDELFNPEVVNLGNNQAQNYDAAVHDIHGAMVQLERHLVFLNQNAANIPSHQVNCQIITPTVNAIITPDRIPICIVRATTMVPTNFLLYPRVLACYKKALQMARDRMGMPYHHADCFTLGLWIWMDVPGEMIRGPVCIMNHGKRFTLPQNISVMGIMREIYRWQYEGSNDYHGSGFIFDINNDEMMMEFTFHFNRPNGYNGGNRHMHGLYQSGYVPSQPGIHRFRHDFMRHGQQNFVGHGMVVTARNDVQLVRNGVRINQIERINRRHHGLVGMYDKFKSNIFVRGGLGDFFFTTKACVFTPESTLNMCFPMAFLRSQCRTFIYERNGVATQNCCNLLEIIESKPFEFGIEAYNERVKLMEEVQVHNVNYIFDNFIIKDLFAGSDLNDFPVPWRCGNDLVMFNPFKKVRSAGAGILSTRYYADLIEEKMPDAHEFLYQWEATAILLHYFVEKTMGREIDVTDLDECMRCYGHVFSCHVHVHRSELMCKKWREFNPEMNPELTSPHMYRHHISMLIKDDHIHAVSAVRKFFQSSLKSTICVHQFCDLCSKVLPNSSNFEKSKEHHTMCALKHVPLEDGEDIHDAMSRMILKCNQPMAKMSRNFQVKEKQKYCVCCRVFKPECDHARILIRNENVFQCSLCYANLSYMDYNHHKCFIHKPKEKAPFKDDKLFVYDVEASQQKISVDDPNILIHSLNLVCVMAVYFTEETEEVSKKCFQNIHDFMIYIMNDKTFENSIFLAHNGGGYDHQYVVRYLEENCIEHSSIPSPNNPHKYFKITMNLPMGGTITFLDFMLYMPGSLKGIAESFGLEVTKGDFPHKFNNGANEGYVGRIPPLKSSDDYFSLTTRRTLKDQKELEKWYDEESKIFCTCDLDCVCTKKKWSFQEEIKRYCFLDVKVLALACRKYRDKLMSFHGESDGWKASSADPFNFMTQSQIALNIFLRGNDQDIALIQNKIRGDFDPDQIVWLVLEGMKTGRHIIHAGNSNMEYYHAKSGCYLDGFCDDDGVAYEFFNCEYSGCMHCGSERILNREMSLIRNATYDILYGEQLNYIERLSESMVVNVMRSCQLEEMIKTSGYNTPHLMEYLRKCSDIAKDREIFYGGRTEVFQAYLDISKMPGYEAKYLDVCSLYPFVCSNRMMPIGHPEIFFHLQCDMRRLSATNPDGYYGFIRCRVQCPRDDLIGLLPSRDKDESNNIKLTFNLHEKIGSWHTAEIYHAMERGYKVLEIFEVKHWNVEFRSPNLFRGYMSFFLQQKVEAGGWRKMGHPNESPTEEEKIVLCEKMFRLNGQMGEPRPDFVRKDPVAYAAAKNFLNCLWAKFSQRTPDDGTMIIYGMSDYEQVMSDVRTDKNSLRFRLIKDNTFKVSYKIRRGFEPVNNHYNIYISSTVTSEARTILHRQMYRIGPERVLYCDTDSIIFIRHLSDADLSSPGLGGWEDEHHGENILYYVGIAPKTYCLTIDKGEEETDLTKRVVDDVKTKGVCLNMSNRSFMNMMSMRNLLRVDVLGDDVKPLQMSYMTIAPNSTIPTVGYAEMITRYGMKAIRAVFSKRLLIPYFKSEGDPIQMSDFACIRLVPFGYHLPGSEHTETEEEELILLSELMYGNLYPGRKK